MCWGVRPGRRLRSPGERACRRPRGRLPERSRVAGSRPGSPRRSARSPFRDRGTLRGDLPSVSSPRASTPSRVQLFRRGPPLLLGSPQVSGARELVGNNGEGKVFNSGVPGVHRGRGGRLEIMTASLVFRSNVFTANSFNDKRGRQLESGSEHAFLSN